jgi:leucyl/phenylalanyl-tRNA--protein transferase
VCLVHLVNRLRRGGFIVCDSQYANEHMTRFGVYELPAKDYLSLLEDAVETDARWDVDGDPLQGR